LIGIWTSLITGSIVGLNRVMLMPEFSKSKYVPDTQFAVLQKFACEKPPEDWNMIIPESDDLHNDSSSITDWCLSEFAAIDVSNHKIIAKFNTVS
jgi:hypothetical protein